MPSSKRGTLRLDDLFNEYKRNIADSERLFNLIMEEAKHLCMGAIYRGRSFYQRISEHDAQSVFHDTFQYCMQRGLKGETKTLSGCLIFFFPRRLLKHGPNKEYRTLPVSAQMREDQNSAQAFMDRKSQESGKTVQPDQETRVLEKEVMRYFLNNLEEFTKIQMEMLILNALSYRHSDIAELLDIRRDTVKSRKFDTRSKATRILKSRE